MHHACHHIGRYWVWVCKKEIDKNMGVLKKRGKSTLSALREKHLPSANRVQTECNQRVFCCKKVPLLTKPTIEALYVQNRHQLMATVILIPLVALTARIELVAPSSIVRYIPIIWIWSYYRAVPLYLAGFSSLKSKHRHPWYPCATLNNQTTH